MFRKLTATISSAASSVFRTEDPNIQRLVGMGFDEQSARNALEAVDGNVDRAAELLLGGSAAAAPIPPQHHQSMEDEDEALQRVMQESLQLEHQRQARQPRTAAMHQAAAATAVARKAKSVTPPKFRANSGGLSAHHPDVKLIPKLQDKSKEEQIIRCADRLKAYPAAVDTLYRALTAVQGDPDNMKYRTVDKTTAGYQRTLATAPGAEDMLLAMNFRPDYSKQSGLLLDRAMVDAALLYLGLSALEQTKLSPEYKQAKSKAVFAKEVREMQMLVNSSETEAIERAALMAKCPTEPASGRGALMQVVLADETVRRRFDGDDTLEDVLNWLGGHGSAIPSKIKSREWSLVDMNRYPLVPIDCNANMHYTLQYIGCWPSGRLQLQPSSDEWARGSSSAIDVKPGSSRGLGSAPTDAVY